MCLFECFCEESFKGDIFCLFSGPSLYFGSLLEQVHMLQCSYNKSVFSSVQCCSSVVPLGLFKPLPPHEYPVSSDWSAHGRLRQFLVAEKSLEQCFLWERGADFRLFNFLTSNVHQKNREHWRKWKNKIKEKHLLLKYIIIPFFFFVPTRSGLTKSEAQVAECTGWRDISNGTGHHPVEQIMITTDHAQKVNNSSVNQWMFLSVCI